MQDSDVDVHWYRKLWLNSPFKQNHRGHRKVCIIDGTIGFTGGVGIAKEWGATPATTRSGGTRTSGWKGQRSTAWLRPSSKTGPRPGAPFTTSVTASLTSRNLVRQRFRWCAVRPASAGTISARSGTCSSVPRGTGVRLQTAYFSPDSRLVAALKEAVGRGVDVDILLP